MLLKRLKNIENKNEQQLEAIRNEGEKQLNATGKYSTSRSQKIGFYNKEDEKAVKLVEKIRKILPTTKNKSFVCTHLNGKQYDFNGFLVVDS